jgi:ATP-binding cassette, subfamily C (CFTR/MRP), member 1
MLQINSTAHGSRASTARRRAQVGIVGRTGAGKSSIVNALFRLAELDGGAIRVDGLDCAVLALGRLRASMALIPQLPVLLSGTLRANLSPAGEYSEAQLWAALRSAHLAGAARCAPRGLVRDSVPWCAEAEPGRVHTRWLQRALARN